jgi:putative MATE family efflux protein
MDLTQGPIPRVLLLFSLPIVAQMSIQPLFAMVDRVFIGQIGPDAFAAVINASVIQMLVITFAAGLANGVTSYVARLVGRGELAEAGNAAWHSMILMIAVSAAFLAVFLPFDAALFRALGVQPELIPRAHDYIKVIMAGNVTIMFSLMGANVLRGEGNSGTPFWIALISLLINLVLAPPLIFAKGVLVFGLPIGWLGLDVFGAALATVIGRGAGCLLLLAYLGLGRSVWTLSLKNFHWDPRHLTEILRVGLPMVLVNLSAWISSLVFLKILNRTPAAVVAYGMGAQLDMLAVLPMIGLMLGVVSMVGQNQGAGHLGRARRTAWIGGAFAAVFSLAMGLLFMATPGFWVGLFDKSADPEIRRLGFQYIHIVGLTYAMVAQVFVLGGAFQGLGKGLPPLIITAARFLLVAIPLVLILPRYIGPSGAWVATASSHVVGGVLSVLWLRFEFKRRAGVAA